MGKNQVNLKTQYFEVRKNGLTIVIPYHDKCNGLIKDHNAELNNQLTNLMTLGDFSSKTIDRGIEKGLYTVVHDGASNYLKFEVSTQVQPCVRKFIGEKMHCHIIPNDNQTEWLGVFPNNLYCALNALEHAIDQQKIADDFKRNANQEVTETKTLFKAEEN